MAEEDKETNPLDLEMDEDKDVTAVFAVKLEVDAPETVTVTRLDFSPFNWWYMPGDTVELLATPDDEDYVVAFWEVTSYASSPGGGNGQALSGGSGNGGGDKTIYPGDQAIFSITQPTLAVPVLRPAGTLSLIVETRWVAGVNVGEVHIDATAEMVEAPVDLGEGRTLYTFPEYEDYVSNPPRRVEVTLEAEANESGWGFVEWAGDVPLIYSNDANPIALTMDANKVLIANFSDFGVDIELKAIRFEDSAEIRSYPDNIRIDNGYHYSLYPPDNGAIAPVRYGFGDKPTMNFELWVAQCGQPEILVRAKVGSTVLDQATVAVGSPPNLVATGSLGRQVAIPGHDKVGGQTTVISLQGSMDNGDTWFKIGSGGPSKWYIMPDTDTLGEKPYDLTLDKNVEWATGLSESSAILSAICNGIAADIYYDPSTPTPYDHILIVHALGRAQCEANVLLMIHHSKVAGIDADILYLWGGSTSNQLEQYEFVDGNLVYGASFRAGLPALDGAPSNPHFMFHVLTVSNGTYYDPSYGTTGLTVFDELMPPYSGVFNVPPLSGQVVITPSQQTGISLPGTALSTGWECPH